MLIDVIRPIRVDSESEFLIDRISNYKIDKKIPPNICFTVVDEGSDVSYKVRIQKECEKHGVNFISLDKISELFCPGRARNYGAMYSNAKYIFFQDLDLVPYEGFYEDLLDQIEISGIHSDPDQFVMIPCVYLTKEGNSQYSGTLYDKKKFIRAAFANDEKLVERYSTGTSACLYNRLKFLQMGGFDQKFIAWGYEDLDLNCRFIRQAKLFPLSRDWSSDKYNFNSVITYEGWKAVYRLFGDMSFLQGMVLFHANHPIHKSRTDYKTIVEQNRRLFTQKLKSNITTPPLPDLKKGRTLLFKPCAFNNNSTVSPLWGEIYYAKDIKTESPDEMMAFIEHTGIDRVVFQNPYADEFTKDVFNKCKDHRIPYYICERGAVPGSCFYDDSGFLYDSKYSKSEYWEKQLTDIQVEEVLCYCKNVLNSDLSLEKQGHGCSSIELRNKYNCVGKKIIFVPLQRPDDTAVKYFVRKNSYSEYLRILQKVSESSEIGNFVLLAKKHPLEDDIEGLRENEHLKFVDSDENVNSLIKASDVVLTFTSGVGLLGLMNFKLVLTVGNSFYTQLNLAQSVNSDRDILNVIAGNYTAEVEKRKPSYLKFIHYLVNDYYSLGEFSTREVKFDNGKRITATTNITFSHLNVMGLSVKYAKKQKPLITFNSGLFDRYKHSMQQARTVETKHVDKMDLAPVVTKKNSTERKLKKLKETPYRYFAESKWGILRIISPLFKK